MCQQIRPQDKLPRVVKESLADSVQRILDKLEARVETLEGRTRDPSCNTDGALARKVALLQEQIDDLNDNGLVDMGLSTTGYDGASNIPVYVNVTVDGKTQSGLSLTLHVEGPNTSSLPTDDSLGGWTNATGWVTSLNNATATYTRLTHPIGASTIRVDFPKTFSGNYKADLSNCSTLEVPTITPEPSAITVVVP